MARELRKEIIAKFPEIAPKKYVEVFVGAGWVLFGKEQVKEQMEVFNDINSDLINLFRCVKYHPQELERELDFIIPAREIFYDYREQVNMPGLTDIQRAARYFYLIKCSFGSDVRSFATCSKQLDHVLGRFGEIRERLRGVVIENRDFVDLIKLYDTANTLFYLDPPYHGTEKHYKADGCLLTESDHRRLRDCLNNISGKFILSYNDDDFVRELYSNYSIESVSRRNNLASNPDKNQRFSELIIKNF